MSLPFHIVRSSHHFSKSLGGKPVWLRTTGGSIATRGIGDCCNSQSPPNHIFSQDLPLQGDNSLALSDHPSPSRHSTLSTITAASILAKKGEREFKQWATAVQLDRDIITSIPSGSPYDAIYTLQQESKQFPPWLASESSSQLQHIGGSYRLVKTSLCASASQASTFGVINFHQQNDPELSSAIGVILQTCFHNQTFRRRSCQPTKMDRRIIIDTMLNHLCEYDENTSFKYSTEQYVKLPNAENEKFHVSNTKADGVLYLDIPDFPAYLANAEFREIGSAFIPGRRANLEVIHCITKFKRGGSGKNQALMGIVSGLYQKKVLNVAHQLVFGIFQHQQDFLQVVAGAWRDNRIQVYNVGSYSLSNPVHTVRLYLVLRGIRKLAHTYLGQLRESQTQLEYEVESSPPVDEWAKDRMDTPNENSSKMDSHVLHDGGRQTGNVTMIMDNGYLSRLPTQDKIRNSLPMGGGLATTNSFPISKA
ncbi:hypothetical protein RSOL_100900 [Rhizoctonia solani AG-3 Rhs1AP]|uniref:Uncharacterized protein n=2 Tax=Rhizoctonia solani AG-3 TaxID=1086053 RepID=A0A074SGU0_9AGAM|nr:hypothetical protein RSOL_100900 [Rhizoctonia solani AG-3 Rhs1AP]KEP49222.1 hypothetical protein V565_105180 [Rhizoctonia solani 123E]